MQRLDTTIQFSGLKPGFYTYNFEFEGSFFDQFKNEKLHDGKVVFDVKLEKKEHLMMFYFTYSGVIQTTCDRCLGEMELPVSGEQTLCVKFSDTEVSDNEDVVILPENEFKIDLAQWMYEYVAVAMPIQCLHPDDENGEPTCDPTMLQYLAAADSPSPADNEDIDPRWAALKNLK